jgi:hypothetical protein
MTPIRATPPGLPVRALGDPILSIPWVFCCGCGQNPCLAHIGQVYISVRLNEHADMIPNLIPIRAHLLGQLQPVAVVEDDDDPVVEE